MHPTKTPFGYIETHSEQIVRPLIDPLSDRYPFPTMRHARLVEALEQLDKMAELGTFPKSAADDIKAALATYRCELDLLEADAVALDERLIAARRAYAEAPGDRATGGKERALRLLFREREPRRGQRLDFDPPAAVASTYAALRTTTGETRFPRRNGRTIIGMTPTEVGVIWHVAGCPKSKPEALRGTTWWHEIASENACAKLLRVFSRSDEAREMPDHWRKLLAADFPRRPFRATGN